MGRVGGGWVDLMERDRCEVHMVGEVTYIVVMYEMNYFLSFGR